VERLLHRCERIVVTACDNSTAVAEAYADFQAPIGVTCDFLRADGYEEARNANADFVFLDPPFSSDSRQDWRDMAHACTRLGPKKIPFVVWYPCSGSSKPQELVDGTGCAAFEVWWDEYAAPQSQSMKGCGMLVSPDLMPIMETAAGELGLLAGALRAQRWGVRYPQRD
jgi:23S rRNA A2030 N6-methylase RlmJ